MGWIDMFRAARETRSWQTFREIQEKQGAVTTSGVQITEQTALAIGAVYSCVRVLSESMAALPLHVYRRTPEGRERVMGDAASRLLSVQTNPRMTAFDWRQTTMVHLAMRGNAYSKIQRDSSGNVIALWPFLPDDVEIRIKDGAVWYHHGGPSPGVYRAEDIVHVRGMSPNGLKGYDPLTACRETMGHASAVQSYGSRMFAKDATPSGVLVHPGTLSKPAAQRVITSWNEQHGGGGGTAVLEEGMEYKPISITPENAQFIESRKLSRSEIAGIFRVPPHMVGDLERATFSNIESQDLAFAKHTLVPWCERIEQVLNLALFGGDEKFFVEHNLSGIMRGDIKSRMEAFGMMWDRGMVTANEIRAIENMNPIDEESGDAYFVPMNFVNANEPPPSRPALPPPDPDPDPDDGSDDQDENAIEIPAVEDRAENTSKEIRAKFARVRHSVQTAHRRVMADAMRRVVRHDAQNLRKAIKDHFQNRDAGTFADWLTEYYSDLPYARNQITPAFTALAESLGPILTEEVGQEWTYNAGLRAWVDSYIENWLRYYARGSMDRINSILDRADSDVEELLIAEIDAWENGTDAASARYAHDADREVTRFGGAFGVAVFVGAGIVSLRWTAVGDTCPFCTEMDGRVVGVGESFAGPGNPVGDLEPGSSVIHPPIHDGCDCIISPEV